MELVYDTSIQQMPFLTQPFHLIRAWDQLDIWSWKYNIMFFDADSDLNSKWH